MRAVRLVRLGKPLEDAEIALPEIGPPKFWFAWRRAGSAIPMRTIAQAFRRLILCQ